MGKKLISKTHETLGQTTSSLSWSTISSSCQTGHPLGTCHGSPLHENQFHNSTPNNHQCLPIETKNSTGGWLARSSTGKTSQETDTHTPRERRPAKQDGSCFQNQCHGLRASRRINRKAFKVRKTTIDKVLSSYRSAGTDTRPLRGDHEVARFTMNVLGNAILATPGVFSSCVCSITALEGVRPM